MATHDLTRLLADGRAADRLAVGSKAASLGELCRAGLPVPAGFVVTTAGFERFMRTADPAGAAGREAGQLAGADAARIAEVTGAIRARITAAELPAELGQAIAARYRELPPGQPVAVRSSATSEDTATASFAGLQDSYLWVCGEQAVLDRVRQCWASVYNAEAVSYRRRQAVTEQSVAMAVVVQAMVDARAAGVMFTCSPTSGDRSVVAIEGSWGLGSVLVGGEVTPDAFVVSKVTGEITRRTVSVKARQHRPDPAGCGVVTVAVPEPLRGRPCLDDEQVRALARIALRVERHCGQPQDIEWALTGDGDIVLLQSRPETVWAGRPAAPLAVPKARAAEHVFEQLGRVVPVAAAEGSGGSSRRETPPEG
jgi:pyruvate, water dikinase